MSGKKPRWRNGVSDGVEATLPRASGQSRGTGSMLDPAAAALLVRSGDEGRVGIPVVARRRPHRLRLGPDDADRAVALELAAVAAVDQPPIVPRLGDDGLQMRGRSRRQRQLAADRRERDRPASIAAPPARAAATSTARSSPSISSRLRSARNLDRPGHRIGAPLRRLQRHHQPRLDLRPRAVELGLAQILRRPRHLARASAIASAARALSVAKLTPNSPVSANPWVQHRSNKPARAPRAVPGTGATTFRRRPPGRTATGPAPDHAPAGKPANANARCACSAACGRSGFRR